MTDAPRFRPDVNETPPPVHRRRRPLLRAPSTARSASSGLYLPPISLGLWWNFGDNIPFDSQRALLRHAFDTGITHFDLANNYGPPYGSAETNFGRMMREDFAPVPRRAHHLVQGRLRHVARARTATSARASTSSRAPSSR